jgi:endoglucanase
MGAMIARGPTLNKLVSQLLADVAESEAIPHGFEVYTRQTATDADEFHTSRAGVPTGLVSIPMRYLHTPNELSALADVEAVIRLLVAATKRLEPGASFVR